ncbi:putative rad21/Rec8-like protein [Helianthus annuus]|uniref:Rad21/Rec8-like protein n=1 Tax=Helianthus annuus TaxID=4232 RepID=A0A9K3IK00_HELAN|nr:putative rad21/Rec8-like protein [Helianthus annuus]KAJ0555924.1 putative rad21/Rec8-like protein [Helianthus annuus]KAJ0727844.1 putative rad21/Rec8-like protein [Helianthus annuus]KAJ0730628.1 putative rad21/Rec8-like protein [Helianthus annuus]KAJ0903970.1 putative rad21/Rec8-like protein [Helianthus annuus]
MFYSQFILAKKGPLGVIWIAVHLERKLRKNQVADTDIGVSVGYVLIMFLYVVVEYLSFFVSSGYLCFLWLLFDYMMCLF